MQNLEIIYSQYSSHKEIFRCQQDHSQTQTLQKDLQFCLDQEDIKLIALKQQQAYNDQEQKIIEDDDHGKQKQQRQPNIYLVQIIHMLLFQLIGEFFVNYSLSYRSFTKFTILKRIWLLFHIFVIVILVIQWPLLIILIVIRIYKLKQSGVQRLNLKFINQIQTNLQHLGSCFNKFKYYYLHQKQSLSSIQISFFLSNLQKLLVLISKQFHFVLQYEGEYIFDQLQTKFFLLSEESAFLIDKFMSQKNNLIFLKYYFWRLRFHNYKLKQMVSKCQLLFDFMQKITRESKQKKQYLINRQEMKVIYSKILLLELKQVYNSIKFSEQKNVKDQHQFAKLYRVLQKQIQLQELMNKKHKVTKTVSCEQTVNQSKDQQVIIRRQKQTEVSFYIDENQKYIFVKQDQNIIKEKLNLLFQQTSNTGQKNKKPKQSQINIEKINSLDDEKQFRSFGISIVPPKRNIEEFYLS